MEEGEKPGASHMFLTWVARSHYLRAEAGLREGKKSFRYESILLPHIQCCPLKYTQFLRLNLFSSKVMEGSSADSPKEQTLSSTLLVQFLKTFGLRINLTGSFQCWATLPP